MKKIQKYASIGIRIRQLRETKKLNQTKFAQQIGISQTFLSDLEKGLTKPTMPVLLAIEYIYGTRKEWVMTGDEPMYCAPVLGPTFINVREGISADKQQKLWVNKLVRIFEEGDKFKIDAIKAQLRAFDPGVKKPGVAHETDDGAEPAGNCG
jgi:transcriptional regulator with XRE-family HTH domain